MKPMAQYDKDRLVCDLKSKINETIETIRDYTYLENRARCKVAEHTIELGQLRKQLLDVYNAPTQMSFMDEEI